MNLPFATLAQAPADAPAPPPAAEAPAAPAAAPAPGLPTVRPGAEGVGATSANPATTQPADPNAAPLGPARSAPPQSPLGGLMGLLPIILLFVVFWFILVGGQRREKKKRAQMLATVAKGAKVQTIGGIIGNVVEVRDNDIVLKVDENNNTKLRLAKSAIQTVLAEKDE